MTSRLLFLLSWALLLAGCVGPSREISGTLVQVSTGVPVAGQALALDRPPGNYPPLAMVVVGVPQQTTIAQTRTDAQGHFQFSTHKDRGRYLRLHLADLPADSTGSPASGLGVVRLGDSLAPPAVAFDDSIVYDARHRWHMRPYPRTSRLTTRSSEQAGR